MDALTCSISTSSKIPPSFPFLTSKPSISFLSRTNRSKSLRLHPLLNAKRPLRIYLPSRSPTTFRISAQFGGHKNRRNSLRKKLNDDLLQVRRNSQNLNFVDENGSTPSSSQASWLEKDGEVASSGRNVSENGELGGQEGFGRSVLWDKLEGWIEQHKKDIEYWGVGSGTIFTVFRNSNGEVERVVVDEDEIMRRRGVLRSDSGEERDLEWFGEVDSRITYAKHVAQEMERGNNVLSESSSVTKFVVSGEESTGVKSGIQSILMQPNLIPKVWMVGIVPVFCFLLVWTVKKLFQGGGKKELSRFKKDMLRRKMKSRMGKESLTKGSIEVVQDSSDLDTETFKKPTLDMKELMNSIKNAKDLNSQLAALDVPNTGDIPSLNVDRRMEEIQKMARDAREMEKGGNSFINQSSTDREAQQQAKGEMNALQYFPFESLEEMKEVSDLEEREVSLGSSAEVPLENACEDEKAVGISNILTENVNEDEETNLKISRHALEIENYDDSSVNQSSTDIGVQQQADGCLNALKDFPLENLGEVKEVSALEKRDVSVGTLGFNSEFPLDDGYEHEKSVPNVLSDSVNSDEEGDQCAENSHCSSNSVDSRNTPSTSHSEFSSTRKKPRVIRSIAEAREYLSNKHHVQSGNGNPLGNDMKGSTDNSSEGDGKEVVLNHKKRLVNEDSVFQPSELVGISDASLIVNEINGQSLEGDECVHAAANGWNGKAHTANISAGDECSSVYMKQNIDKEETKIKSLESAGSVASDSNVSINGCEKSELDCQSAQINDFNMEVKGDIEQRISAYEPAIKENPIFYSDQSLNDGPEMPVTINSTNIGESNPTSAAINPNNVDLEEEKVISTDLDTGEFVEGNKDEFSAAASAPKNSEKSNKFDVEELPLSESKWLEKHFDDLSPVIDKIGAGFSQNYAVAKEKVMEGSDLTDLSSIMNYSELEWMNDDKLREIVFRVQDNELAGRDPFHSIDAEDKIVFFKGLEEKVEKTNESLAALHEWLHSNIENVDYGSDVMSIYDPPEKIVPRWKGPPAEAVFELFSKMAQKQNEPSAEDSLNSQSTNNDPAQQKSPKKSSSSPVKVPKISKTVIESSDGSVRPGKKTGKEHWEHTKRWSDGFIQVYEAQTDPEVKAAMKDIGKDLDRWVTEDEIKKARELMSRLPNRRKAYVEKRLNKLRQEVKQFGAQAVVSKYREYGEEEEDYLWWLDLSYVLCIELYTHEGDEKEDVKIGFYTVEMATDLNLDPKAHHVIAFEDRVDSINFCHIIHSHLEMLGKGAAFVVPQHPKDAYRDAKANGFGVTVIRKGEIQLHVDQALEEVEELISEIGSKMYHDKITREHEIDFRAVMKGAFASEKGKRGFGSSMVRRRRKLAKRRLKNPNKK